MEEFNKNLKEKDQLGNLGVDRKIILKFVFGVGGCRLD
jgi:hypothetical protein